MRDDLDAVPVDVAGNAALAPVSFTIPADHPSLAGHFPGHPIVPGVVLLDQVLQAIEAQHAPIGALRMAQVKFMQPLLPGQPARVQLEGATPRWRFRVLRCGDAPAPGMDSADPAAELLLASGDVAVP